MERWGARMNLSAHRDPESIARRLVLDAAGLLTTLPAFASLVDIGSGAGFPGIPLAILHSTASATLIESRERRVHFLRAAIRELGLAGRVTALHGRAEMLEARPAELVTLQAVAQIGVAVRLALPWCQATGTIAIPSSSAVELPEVPAHWHAEARPYAVPHPGPGRSVVLIRQLRQTE
jgi:16S rRNA (guanine527-N7)-methyltransferase